MLCLLRKALSLSLPWGMLSLPWRGLSLLWRVLSLLQFLLDAVLAPKLTINACSKIEAVRAKGILGNQPERVTAGAK
jgi:hypothetical protein